MFGLFKKKKFDIRNTRIVIDNYEFIPIQVFLFSIGCDWLHYNMKTTSLKNDIISVCPYNTTKLIIDIDNTYSFVVKSYPGDKMKSNYKIMSFDELKIYATKI